MELTCTIIFDPNSGQIKNISCQALGNKLIMKGMLSEAVYVIDRFHEANSKAIIEPPQGLDVSGKRPS